MIGVCLDTFLLLGGETRRLCFSQSWLTGHKSSLQTRFSSKQLFKILTKS